MSHTRASTHRRDVPPVPVTDSYVSRSHMGIQDAQDPWSTDCNVASTTSILRSSLLSFPSSIESRPRVVDSVPGARVRRQLPSEQAVSGRQSTLATGRGLTKVVEERGELCHAGLHRAHKLPVRPIGLHSGGIAAARSRRHGWFTHSVLKRFVIQGLCVHNSWGVARDGSSLPFIYRPASTTQ